MGTHAPVLVGRSRHVPRSLEAGVRGTSRRVTTSSRAAKRCIDLAISVVALVCTFPLFLAIAIAIKLDSKGPALYVHRRVGKHGKPLRVIKFRTMVLDADRKLHGHLARRPEQEAAWNASHKLRDDPRVTRVGRFLRRLSLDELPQLLNVLRGDMSLVGPRPVIEDELQRFGSSAAIILAAIPGITGLWAVSGRSDISYNDRVELERRYVMDWSLRLDLSILVRTIPVVIRGRGSY